MRMISIALGLLCSLGLAAQLDFTDKFAKYENGSDGSPASLPLQPIVITGTAVTTP